MRRIKLNNNEIKIKQSWKGMWDYRLGDILFGCLGKNKNKFSKKGINFEYLGLFLNYLNGNVMINLLNKDFTSKGTIVVPIYLTKFCPHNIMSISDNIFTFLGYRKPKITYPDFIFFNDEEQDRIIM
ncbi:MAG: hypothetical protein Ta2E_00600 [Mycoplasmoidaceae bacterium]|nr:MAG: hypothetical protein Ta2E_00600 [Mycoplasmoidaceae bacterium]